MINTHLTVFLQETRKQDGYEFTSQRNAEFTFSLWLGITFAELYGHCINDWLLVRLSRRFGEKWKPKYRLYTLWLPSLILLPIGLGMFGVALQYYTHYTILALRVFLIIFSALLSILVTVNYVIECFWQYILEMSVIIGAYRLTFGLAVFFFFIPWERTIDIG